MLLLLASLTPFATAALTALMRSWKRAAALAASALLLSLILLLLASRTRPIEEYHFEPALDLVVFEGSVFNLLFAALASLLCVVQAVVSPYFVAQSVRGLDPRTYYALFLISAGALLATPISGSLTTFFLFFEAYLLSTWLLLVLILRGRAAGVASKYLLFTEAGALVTLLGLVLVYDELGTFRFDRLSAVTIAPEKAALLSLLMLSAPLVKMAIFPLHAWLPDVYSAAPIPLIGMAVAAETLAAWAATRLLLLWPHALRAYNIRILVVALGIFTAIYGNLNALVEKDFRRLLAFASIGGGGLLLSASAFSEASLASVALLSLDHALAENVLITALGYLEKELEVKTVTQVGGLASCAPRTAVGTLIASLSLAGAPPTLGFWAETAILASMASVLGVNYEGITLMTSIALALFLRAAYSVWLFKRVFFGNLKVVLREAWCSCTLTVLVLSVMLVALGAYPAAILNSL